MTATQYTCSLNSVYCLPLTSQQSDHCSQTHIPVCYSCLPGYIDVVQTVLLILTMAGLFWTYLVYVYIYIHTFFFPVEMGLIPRIVRKAFYRPEHQKLWCGKIYPGGNKRLSLCPISDHPAMEKTQTYLPKIKASVQSYCFILKLSPLKPTGSC